MAAACFACLESRVYAGLNSSAFHVYTVLSRCAVLTRLKAVLQTVIAFPPVCSYNTAMDAQAMVLCETIRGG